MDWEINSLPFLLPFLKTIQCAVMYLMMSFMHWAMNKNIVLSYALRTNDMEVRFNNSRMIWLFSSEQYFV